MAKKKTAKNKKSADKSKKPKALPTKLTNKPLTGAFRLFGQAIKLLNSNWRLFLTIIAIYGLLSIILVRGIGAGLNLSAFKETLTSGLGNNLSQLATGATLFGYLLLSSGGSVSPTASVYQTLLVIVMSLVVIWSLRQILAGHKVKARDAFYNSTYPLIQFILVLLVISLQMLPLLLGSWVYAVVVNGIMNNPVEQFIGLLIFALLAGLSLYLVSSSVFALYIVSLPNMTPMKALRSARALVKHHRFLVLRKLLFLPLAILILGAIIMIPLILILTPMAEWIFFALSMTTLVLVHSYIYLLYRELL